MKPSNAEVVHLMAAGSARPTGWRRMSWHLSFALPLILTATLAYYVPARAAEPGGLETAQKATSVRVNPIPRGKPRENPALAAAKVVRPEPVWPSASTNDVGVSRGVAAGSTVVVSAAKNGSSPATARVQVLSQQDTQKLGVRGIVARIGRTDGATVPGPLNVSIDYTKFRTAFGGDWDSRLHLVQLPECALTQPSTTGCQGKVLSATNNLAAGVISADVDVAPLNTNPKSRGVQGFESSSTVTMAGTMIALMSGPSGNAGNFGATSLAPSFTWAHTGSTGGFTWSYPMRTPPGNGGPVPDVGLAYSSQSVDGRHAASNNQPGLIGEGFSYDSGFIERKYKSCADDMGGGANNGTKTGDLCWGPDNAFMSLAGSATELIKATDGTWHPVREDGSKVELLTGGPGGGGGQHWRITDKNGTKFWFGKHQLPGWSANKSETNSVLTVPVAGNNSGEPCYQASFAGSFCDQPYRWNLDYVEDVYGNTMSLWYTRESNYYARNLQTGSPVSYHRDSFLTQISYGTDNRSGTDSIYSATPVPAQIDFTPADRCLNNCTVKNDVNWPDTPTDQECGANGTCNNVAPTFFSTARLTKVSTKVWKALESRYQAVDEWNLRQEFLDPGDGTRAGLWLAGITHKGLNGATEVVLPEITFTGIQMSNRVDTANDWAPAMNWWRVGSIVTESGGEIYLVYSDPECVAGSVMPAAPDNNWRRCFPVRWAPTGGPNLITDYFHKYVVKEIRQIDHTGNSPPVKTVYEYKNPANLPLWHYDEEDGLVDVSRKSWGQWRGYPTVVTKIGEGLTEQVSESLYFRGMHGDRLSNGSSRSVTVQGLEGSAVTDYQQYAGMVREQVSWLGSQVLAASVATPWRSEPTATRTIGSTVTEARYVRPAGSDTRRALDGGGWRRVGNLAEYDATGRITFQHDLGETGTADDRCTKTEYANTNPNGGVLVEFPSRIRGWAGACGTESYDPARIFFDVKYVYDGLLHGQQPTKGSLTSMQALTDIVGQTRSYQTRGSFTYDVAGRRVTTTDVAGEVTKTEFTPALGGPVTAIKTINPLNWSSTDTLDPAWGVTTKSSDINGRLTEIRYDALGRSTDVWYADRPSASKSPNVKYEYELSSTGVSGVATSVLNANEGYTTSFEIVDSLLRPRQAQGPAVGGGRVVTDQFYDNAGRVWKTNGAYHRPSAPDFDLLDPYDVDIAAQSRIQFDAAGRVIVQAFYSKNVEQWNTTAEYRGDRVLNSAPAGAAARETHFDARGQVTKLRQFHSSQPTGTYDDITYTYTIGGLLDTVVDPMGNTWDYDYDLQGRLIATSDPDKGDSTLTYNQIGQLETSTDARNEKLAYTYDRLGRPTSIRDDTTSGNLRSQWTYDLPFKGLTKSASRWVDGNKYETQLVTVDAMYRPTQTRVIIPSNEGALSTPYYAFRYSYKADGSPDTIIYPEAGGLSGETVTYGYDETLGLPKTLKTNYNSVTTPYYVVDAGYTEFGETAFINRARDITGYPVIQSVYNYEEETRRLSRHAVNNTASLAAVDSTYRYDDAGNVLSIDDNPAGGQRDKQCFTYDPRQQRRLAEAWTPASYDCSAGPAVALGGPAPYRQSWTFDAAGNRTQQKEYGTPQGTVTSTYVRPPGGNARPHAVTEVQRQTSSGTTTKGYVYDDAGNTVNRPGQVEQQTLKWDAEGFLVELKEGTSNTHSYVYDASGTRLIAKDPGGTTLHLGLMDLRLVGTVVMATRYYTFNGEVVAQRTGSGVQWLCSDPQGTQQVTVSVDGSTVNRRRQTPYGQERGTSQPWANPKGFVGGHKDPSGLVHVGARQYDQNLGSFISVDPVIDHADIGQMNAYSYANNSPVTFSDPSGLKYEIYTGGGGGWGRCNDVTCGFVEGVVYGVNPWSVITGIAAVIKNPAAAFKHLEDDAEKWTKETGDPIAGWTCALSGLCEMIDICRQSFSSAECGRVLGLIAVEVTLAVLSGGTSAVGTRLADLARSFNIDIPSSIKKTFGIDQETNPSLPGSNDGGNTPEERAAQNQGSSPGGGSEGGSGGGGGGTGGGDGNGGSGSTDCQHSFDPGTQVLLADGTTKAISDIELGDEVTATEPTTGETTGKVVTATHHNLDIELTDVTVVSGQTGELTTLKTTAHHPFWDATAKAWTDAAKLTPGHQLRVNPLVAPTGRSGVRLDATVAAVHTYTGGSWMHDLTVADFHTYYVLSGELPVLVHNCNEYLYRGIWPSHPDYNDALNGTAIPTGWNKPGPKLTPEEHNAGMVGLSDHTSWTTRKTEAFRRAKGGVVLRICRCRFPTVDSPDYHNEGEVLIYGPVTGAERLQ